MKRVVIAMVVVGWLVLVGYAVARSLPAAAPALAQATVTPLIPQPMPTARVPQELTYYRKRCWPACHYDPSWKSEEPPRIAETFDDAPGTDWTWMNEEGSLWSLEEMPGALHIVAPGTSVRRKGGGLEGVTNVLGHAAPATHFDVMARVTFDAAGSPQSAGVFIEMDDGSLLWLGRGRCEETHDPACLGEGVYLDGVGLGCGFKGIAVLADMVDLMLRKAGNSYIGYYQVSEGRESAFPTELGWVEVGRCYSRSAVPDEVGLAVSNGGPAVGEAAADFEQVTLVERK